MTDEKLQQLLEITAFSIALPSGHRIYGSLEAIRQVQALRRRLRALEAEREKSNVLRLTARKP